MFGEARRLFGIGVLVCLASGWVWPQEVSSPAADSSSAEKKAGVPLTFRGDAAVVSKYIWRGQRLTNDWSLQPAMTVGLGDFSLNVWGTLDMAAVNEGTGLFLPGNPTAPPGDRNGLQGKFSEVDYTFSYGRSIGSQASLTGGAIVYTFPERGATLKSTSELFAGVSLPEVMFSPSATLYVDVDESLKSGSSGLYLKLGVARSIPLRHHVFSSLDIASSLAFADSGFGSYYYGAQEAGPHDFNLTLTFPMRIGEHWSASACMAYSSLLGSFRDLQYPDLRQVYRGQTGPGKPDTVWGGGTLSLTF
jgi:hypothetical protein